MKTNQKWDNSIEVSLSEKDIEELNALLSSEEVKKSSAELDQQLNREFSQKVGPLLLACKRERAKAIAECASYYLNAL